MNHQAILCFCRLAESQWVVAMLHDSWMKHVNAQALSVGLTHTLCDIRLPHT
jgi:hypothetical protein